MLALAAHPAIYAATRIVDPKAFVTEVYNKYVRSQSTHKEYEPPEDIYTDRLAKLIQDDRKKAHGEVGCLDFDFWVDGQDFTITNLKITEGAASSDRKTVIASFRNLDANEEIHFEFRQTAGRWLLDEVRSVKKPAWTLSQILKCQY